MEEMHVYSMWELYTQSYVYFESLFWVNMRHAALSNGWIFEAGYVCAVIQPYRAQSS